MIIAVFWKLFRSAKIGFLLVLYIPFVKYACILRWPIKNHVKENLNPRPKTSVKSFDHAQSCTKYLSIIYFHRKCSYNIENTLHRKIGLGLSQFHDYGARIYKCLWNQFHRCLCMLQIPAIIHNVDTSYTKPIHSEECILKYIM